MPRSGPNGTYTLPGAQATQVAGTPIPSAVNNQGYSDIEQTFNTIQPVPYGGTGVADGKPLDNTFGVKNSTDLTKIGVFSAANIPAGQTRTYDLPYYSGTLGLVSDIRGQMYGLTLSNNVTDPTNDIDIAAGAAVDSTGAVSMLLASSLTKRLDAAWAVGTGNGGLDSGVVANTVYYIYLIRRPDTGVVDAIFSTSKAAPTLPTNYTQYVRLPGAIFRAAGANRPFMQVGKNQFLFKTAVADAVNVNVGTARTLLGLTTPRDMISLIRASVYRVAGATALVLQPTYETDAAPSSTTPPGFSLVSEVANAGDASEFNILVDGSTQIAARANAADSLVSIFTKGFIDPEF